MNEVERQRMILDGYAEARALAHESVEMVRASDALPGNLGFLEVAVLMLDRAKDLLQPEPK